MQLSTATIAFLAATQASGVSATWWGWGTSAGSTGGILSSINCALLWNWGSSQCSSGTKLWTWPPTAPSGCPSGYPWAQVPWKYEQWKFPGKCPSHPWQTGPKYPPGCNNNPPKNTNFTLACPTKAAGQIFDGQIQCNSPYPGQEVNAGRVSFISSSFYILNGGLYDQLGRGCEISAGNQLQCNALTNGATAEAGFAIDASSNLIWQGENTWYGCNIGTDSSYGQIIFTGTHKDFSGSSAATENANCAAYRLGVVYK